MSEARVWEETVQIPTYPVGKPEKNPMFIEKRVYQGSSGRVYPYPTIESIGDVREDHPYRVVFLENEYLKVMVLPELGGRIQRAQDKTTGYDFVYYNHVIKPALVGLLGPWISGGIEFNWPQHHRPTTFLPADYVLEEGEDGSASVLLHDVDRIYGTKAICRITLRPGKARIEITGQLYNRTALPQSFLWWANPAVPVNDNTQTIMPPDVHAVMDHGKRDVSRWPIAMGSYYKKDYSEGVDISRYKNIPVPTSLMAAGSRYDFVGGYDYGVQEGILHVADHHISPGKKQWTWGCGDFGRAWDRNLTDGDGPYVELMTGVFTDNQPDFTWLKPFEEKTFTQYFMPYRGVGAVKNATEEACVSLQTDGGRLRVAAYAVATHPRAQITVMQGDRTILRRECCLSPEKSFDETILLEEKPESESELSVRVSDGEETLVFYRPDEERIPEIPDPAEAPKPPAEIMTNEELYLTGLHLEQYRHATFLPDPYYLEGLKRDPGDMRINNAYGMLLLRRGKTGEAELCFRRAVKRLTLRNANAYDGEAFCNLGLCLLRQGKKDEAADALYRAAWTAEQQHMAFYYLACIEAGKGKMESALTLIERSLARGSRSVRVRALKAVLLRKTGRFEEAKAWLRENLVMDPFDYVSGFETILLREACGDDAALLSEEELARRSRRELFHFLRAARDYAEAGFFEEALRILQRAGAENPLTAYYQAYYLAKLGKEQEAREAVETAERRDPYCCFPNDLEDIPVLEYAIQKEPAAARARYYLGNLLYDKLRWQEAGALWEASAAIDPGFPTVYRNLSLVYYNRRKEPERAREVLERAFVLDPTDARMFWELDQLYRNLGWSFAERLLRYREHIGLVRQRDDLSVEYVTLLNAVGCAGEALDFLQSRHFHPWEGGEGRVTAQYGFTRLLLALEAMDRGEYGQAKRQLLEALSYPENLGEGKLEGTKDNHICYYLGLTEERLGDKGAAEQYFRRAAEGTDEPAGMMYYNDQPADMIFYQGLAFRKLGDPRSAGRRFCRLLDYGERHSRDHVHVEYFAVSMPDFLTFENDLDVRNEAHCDFLMAMGHAGLGDAVKAKRYLAEARKKAPSDFRMLLMSNMLEENRFGEQAFESRAAASAPDRQ